MIRDRWNGIRKEAAAALRIGRALLHHDAVPRASKILLGLALAYAAMPFDLVPDWIPIVGQLDDVLIIGVLVWLAWRFVPADVRRDCRAEAATETSACSSRRGSVVRQGR